MLLEFELFCEIKSCYEEQLHLRASSTDSKYYAQKWQCHCFSEILRQNILTSTLTIVQYFETIKAKDALQFFYVFLWRFLYEDRMQFLNVQRKRHEYPLFVWKTPKLREL